MTNVRSMLPLRLPARPPEALVLITALLARVWRLNYHSIWFDEAVSLSWAGADPGYTWQITFRLVEEKHPPVYYLLLHYWQRLLGLFGLAQNDAALRLLGALLGVLTVWAIMALAGRLSGRRVGLLAGLLTALSPVLVWYSQELRMFQPAAALLASAAWSLLAAWQAERPGARVAWWGAFVLAFTAALYSYLFTAFMLPAAGLTLLALAAALPRRPRRFWEGAAALALVTLLFLPLAYNAWGVNAAEGTPGRAFAGFLSNAWRLLRIFTVWRSGWPAALETAALAFLAALVLTGLFWPARESEAAGAPRLGRVGLDQVWLLLWVGAPLLVANLLLSSSGSIFSEDRYLIFMAPYVLWAAARGAWMAGSRLRPPVLRPAVGLAAAVLLILALSRLWSPELRRENWRAAVEYVTAYQTHSAPLRAAWVAHIDYTRRPVEWYLRQQYSFDELPAFFPYGGALHPEDADTVVGPPLQGIVELGVDTLWLTQSHLEGMDDSRLVEGWLAQRFPLVTEQYPAGVKLSGYALRSRYDALPELGEHAVFPARELAPGLALAACEVVTPLVAAQDDALHPPSGWAHVRLWWQAVGPIGDDYTAAVQMVGPEGVWGDRLPSRDGDPLRREPTSTWTAGQFVRDEVDVNLNPLTPPGSYPIVVGLIDSSGATVGETVECGRVTVE